MKSIIQQFRDLKSELYKNQAVSFKRGSDYTLNWINRIVVERGWPDALEMIKCRFISCSKNLKFCDEASTRDWIFGVVTTCEYFLEKIKEKRNEILLSDQNYA